MFEQLFVLLELPLELTFQALLELLVFGERSHQLAAELTSHTPDTRRAPPPGILIDWPSLLERLFY